MLSTGSSSSFLFSSSIFLSLLWSGQFLLACCKFTLFLYNVQSYCWNHSMNFLLYTQYFSLAFDSAVFWDLSSAHSFCPFPLNPWTHILVAVIHANVCGAPNFVFRCCSPIFLLVHMSSYVLLYVRHCGYYMSQTSTSGLRFVLTTWLHQGLVWALLGWAESRCYSRAGVAPLPMCRLARFSA